MFSIKSLTFRRLFTTLISKRNPNFSQINNDDIAEFKKILASPLDVIEDESELGKYNVDWTRKFKGRSTLALRPSSTQQVSDILKYCNERKLAITPQGGNTGLVGGGVPVYDEIVLSLEKMNKIISHDEVAGVVTVEAGCILEVVDGYLRERGSVMPLDLGAKGSCTIGGNIATNAGGLRLLRYGSLHGNVLGLRTVLADGTVLEGLNGNRKDNTGIDSKQLFIGSEGTLGIITAASILTPPVPTSVNVAVFAVSSFDVICEIFGKAKRELGEILSAFEFWDHQSHVMVAKHFTNDSRRPKIVESPFYILVETSGSNQESDMARMMEFVEGLQEGGLIVDGTLAQDETQLKSLWALRENIPEACSKEGLVYKYDVSLPSSRMYEPVLELRKRLDGIVKKNFIIGYGHFGDGNIHLNITTTKDQDKSLIQSKMEPFIYEYISSCKGSISAEHGIGIMKADYLHYSKSLKEIALMRRIKSMMDPNGILNPYKVLN